MTIQLQTMGPIVAWIERTLPPLRIPWKRHTLFGRWEQGTMQAVSLEAALLPLLATIEPAPLASTYMRPPVPQLKVSLHASRSIQEPIDASVSHARVSEVVSATRAWLCDTVMGEHEDCYKYGASHLWGDRDYLAFRPEFCRRAYAFTLWQSRTQELLNEIRDAGCFPNQRIAIDPIELRDRLISSYHAALNNVELLFAMYDQKDASLCDAVMDSGCLERGWDPWTELEVAGEHTYRLAPCTVAFAARPDTTELFCDDGAMVQATWDMRKRVIERLDARSDSGAPSAH